MNDELMEAAYRSGRADLMAELADILDRQRQCGETLIVENETSAMGHGIREAAVHISREIAELPDLEVGSRLELLRRAHDMQSQKDNLGGEM